MAKDLKEDSSNGGVMVLIGVVFCLLAVVIFVNLYTAVRNPQANTIGSSFYESRLE